jgi:hypothetical protein
MFKTKFKSIGYYFVKQIKFGREFLNPSLMFLLISPNVKKDKRPIKKQSPVIKYGTGLMQ